MTLFSSVILDKQGSATFSFPASRHLS